ncbi:Hypothetical Protein GBS85147_1898 [Streptococcus agalactiae]|nr:Hypothetical Protein GBS85147_1898 [Streptococcus agalactiae]CCQ81351.1 hypothetical protein GBS1173_1747 [Streptococcus agalactiae CF01173]
MFSIWPSSVTQYLKNPFDKHYQFSFLQFVTLYQRVSLCIVYFLQYLQNLFTSSRVGLGVLLTPIE